MFLAAAGNAREVEPAPKLPVPPLLRCGLFSILNDELAWAWDDEGI